MVDGRSGVHDCVPTDHAFRLDNRTSEDNRARAETHTGIDEAVRMDYGRKLQARQGGVVSQSLTHLVAADRNDRAAGTVSDSLGQWAADVHAEHLPPQRAGRIVVHCRDKHSGGTKSADHDLRVAASAQDYNSLCQRNTLPQS